MAKHKKEEEITGGQLGEYPNEKYAKFFATFKEIDELEVSKWKPAHLLAYFTKKYNEHYNTQYSFKFNSPSPAKCFEVFQIKRLGMLLSSNPEILKKYIDWVFENKVVKAKRKLTSISFMTNDGVVNEYKINVLLANKNNLKVDRSSPLTEKYIPILQKYGIFAQTYGDLAFLSQMEQTEEMTSMFQELYSNGLDKELLARII